MGAGTPDLKQREFQLATPEILGLRDTLRRWAAATIATDTQNAVSSALLSEPDPFRSLFASLEDENFQNDLENIAQLRNTNLTDIQLYRDSLIQSRRSALDLDNNIYSEYKSVYGAGISDLRHLLELHSFTNPSATAPCKVISFKSSTDHLKPESLLKPTSETDTLRISMLNKPRTDHGHTPQGWLETPKKPTKLTNIEKAVPELSKEHQFLTQLTKHIRYNHRKKLPKIDPHLHQKSHIKRVKEQPHSTSVVVVQPPTIVFTDFQLNETYRKTFLVVNTGSVSGRVRISPETKSHCFKFHPTFSNAAEVGLVAPGMYREYTVVFSPPVLADFECFYKVSTNLGESVIIPVFARRNPPKLVLAHVLDCGPCKLGSSIVKCWDIQNVGGPGMFEFQGGELKSIDSMIKEVVETRELNRNFCKLPSKSLKCSQFEVHPQNFCLKENEVCTIYVKYSPEGKGEVQDEEADEAFAYLISDEGDTNPVPLKGSGQVPEIQILSIYDQSEKPILVNIVNGNPAISFDEKLFTFHFYAKELCAYDFVAQLQLKQIQNEFSIEKAEQELIHLRCSASVIPHYFRLKTPELRLFSPIYVDQVTATSVSIDNSNMSAVEYSWKILPELGVLGFITVEPHSGIFQPKCHLSTGKIIRVLLIVDVILPPDALQFNLEVIDFNMIALGTSAVAQAKLINTTGLAMSFKLDFFSDGYNDIEIERSSGVESKILPEKNFTQIEPVSGTIEPVFGEVQTPLVKLLNVSSSLTCFVDFAWDDVQTDLYRIKFNPSADTIHPHKTMDVEVEICCFKQFEMESITLCCRVAEMVASRGILGHHLCLTAISSRVKFIFGEAVCNLTKGNDGTIDFGRCRLLEIKTKRFSVQNCTGAPLIFKAWVDQFPARDHEQPAVDKQEDQMEKACGGSDNVILARTAISTIGFVSKNGEGYIQKMKREREMQAIADRAIREGRGAAFAVVPSQAQIEGFGVLECAVTSYAKSAEWYSDVLHLHVSNSCDSQLNVEHTVQLSLSVCIN
ncbi:hypothetical protein BJ742DRAFT_873529 [Cladochytrium replicatum]|nr:hypothetical protein BJ742DRAFT_873529 [Cladochytrium replicatum]